MIKILYEDNHVLVVEKPVNIPVQADQSHDEDLLTILKNDLKVRYNKPGNVYLGLVHRLDRPVGGVMVFAKTSKAASRLSDAVRTHKLTKDYFAITDGIPSPKFGTLDDRLLKDTKTNRVRVHPDGKPSRLHYEVLGESHGHALVLVHLETGRSHQIRVQFSSRGWPLVNDQRYHPNPKKGQIALWATTLSFPHPTTKETITMTDIPPMEGPWKEFEVILRDHKEKETV